MTARMEILGDDGEWQEVPGVVSVEIRAEVPDWASEPACLLQSADVMPLVVAFARKAKAEYERVFDQVAQQMKQAAAAGRAYEAALKGRPDRPAWQSPYGPARRRR
ncbi:hypothetical protein AB0F46_29455 [Streptomyces sp. NPDC026665]|uniref:hypothetical protein n=1 Tax=Streptomyces sp. NPDC026665 TaxID=3154798 RepID=UPI0033C6F189